METDLWIIVPAWLAGILILLTHVPLGQQVIKRGIIFIDLAIAQIAGVGVLVAQYLGFAQHGIAVQLFAIGFALSGVLVLAWTDQRFGEIQEAIIGGVFVLAASAGVMLFSKHPQGMEHIAHLLNGEIIWVDYSQLVPVAIIYALILLFWFGPWWQGSRLRFYLLFAVSVTVSVQMAGVYLVFASLIFPALAVRRLHNRAALWTGLLTGLAGYSLGLMVSYGYDFPAGPTTVWCLAVCCIIAAVVIEHRTGIISPAHN